MVTLETKYSRLCRLIGKELSKEELENVLTNLGIEIKLWKDDTIKLEFEPGRPDLYCGTIGVARAIKYYLELEKEIKTYEVKPSNYEVYVSKEVIEYRPYTAWAVVKNIFIDSDLLEELKIEQEILANNLGRKRRKFSIGIYPLRKIKWPVYFKMKKPEEIFFTPLDFSTSLSAKEILEFHPKGKEYGYLIKDWSKYPVFEDAEGKILSLVPIINSEEVGKVCVGDKEIAIEVTGTNEYYVKKALDILVCNLADLGGEIYSVKIVYPFKKDITPTLKLNSITVKKSNIEKLLGISLTHKEIINLLKRMGLDGKTISTDEIEVRYPPYRLDILDERDVIEDIAIAYGYENFEISLPKMFTSGELSLVSKIQQKIRELMVGLGFNEVMTFALTNLNDQYTKMKVQIPEWAPIIENSVEKYLNTIRTWILPELLKFLFYNKSKEYPIKIFDIDYVVELSENSETGYKNSLHLALLISNYTVTYTEIRQVVEYILDRLGIEYKINSYEHPSFIEGRCACIIVNGKSVGFMGELHPEVIINFGLEKPVAAAELDISKIFNL